jgi:phenylacetate-CoA ligase
MKRTFDQAWHRAAYMSLQHIRGRPVGRYVRHLQARERLERRAFQDLIANELRETLRYARERVPLYSTGAWQQALAKSDPADIRAWPVLERQTIKTRAGEMHAKRLWPNFYRHSSASTGEPVRVAWSANAAGWGWANEYHVMLWHGIPPGVRTLLMWGSDHRFLQDTLRNCRGIKTTELTPERLEEAAQFVLQRRPDLIMGLPSAITRLARHIRANYPDAPYPLVPYAKIGGEQVYPFQRDELERRLGAKVIQFYGCTEMGPIAAECPAGSMHVMSDNVHIEIFRDGAPAAPGEFGDIIATSMRNRAMPLIRCKIGDTGRLSPEPCVCGRPYPVLAELVGRAADLFVTADGRKVHGYALGRGLQELLSTAPLGAVHQVLFQQIDPLHWKVLVESGNGFDTPLATSLTELVRVNFGNECDVQIERVPVVPRETSGKFRYYRPASARANVSETSMI